MQGEGSRGPRHLRLAGCVIASTVTIGVAFLGASAQSAAVQSTDRCVSGATHVVIAGRHRCLMWGTTCRSRFNSTYHRYLFNCSGGFLVYWWAGLTRRPLQIPSLQSGSVCPATEAKGTLGERDNLDAPGAPAFGPGPAYPTLGSDGGRAVLRYPVGWAPYWGWDGTKSLWTVPRYSGPYIVRGRQLDGPNGLQFDQGPNWSNELHAELRLVGPYPRLNPAATYLRAPGCYAYQVDGRGFSYLIVFVARITSPS
jgi:hypothetical protein